MSAGTFKQDGRVESVAVNRARLDAEARVAGYAAINGYLVLHAIFADTFALPPDKQLLYITVLAAAVQRVIRSGALPNDLHGATPLPDAHVVYISRRALAAATGMSRETVRRIVRQFLAEGLLSEGPRGGLAARTGLLAQPHVQHGLVALITEYGAITDRLLKLGVFEIQD